MRKDAGIPATVLVRLRDGVVIPAMPLALDAQRRFDEQRQRALTRYYLDAGAGGLAVGVHSTQFEIREPEFGLYEPVLSLVAETMEAWEAEELTVARIAGICGDTAQAVAEATLAREKGYQIGLLSLAALKTADENVLVAHCRRVAEVIPLFGFYLQPAVGGRVLPYRFWREFAEIPQVVGIKMAPFNRYQTLDVLRGVHDSGRSGEIALYTGNDDNIVADLLTRFEFDRESAGLRIVGGLLGHWAVWTRKAVELLDEIHQVVRAGGTVPEELLTRAAAITDCNAAFFDVAHGFAGCIPGIHEVLRRQGLLEGTWCLNPEDVLSPGQSEEIDRVVAAYPHLADDDFVSENIDRWLR